MFSLIYDPYFLAGWILWLTISITLIINDKKSLPKFNIFMYFFVILYATLYAPINEESLFRHTLPYYFGDYAYFKIINAILFGLMHSINVTITTNIKALVCQVIFATFMGWYFVSLNSFTEALYMHMLVNFVNICAMIFVITILNYRNKTSIIINDEEEYVCYSSLKPSKSCNNIIGKEEKMIAKFVDVDKTLIPSFNKYKDILFKKRGY